MPYLRAPPSAPSQQRFAFDKVGKVCKSTRAYDTADLFAENADTVEAICASKCAADSMCKAFALRNKLCLLYPSVDPVQTLRTGVCQFGSTPGALRSQRNQCPHGVRSATQTCCCWSKREATESATLPPSPPSLGEVAADANSTQGPPAVPVLFGFMIFVIFLMGRYNKRARRLDAKAVAMTTEDLDRFTKTHVYGGGAPSASEAPSSCHVASDSMDSEATKSAAPCAEEADAECHLCLSPFAAGELLRTLPCNHTYHAACVDRWLLVPGSSTCNPCPTCRQPITQGRGRPSADLGTTQRSGESREEMQSRTLISYYVVAFVRFLLRTHRPHPTAPAPPVAPAPALAPAPGQMPPAAPAQAPDIETAQPDNRPLTRGPGTPAEAGSHPTLAVATSTTSIATTSSAAEIVDGTAPEELRATDRESTVAAAALSGVANVSVPSSSSSGLQVLLRSWFSPGGTLHTEPIHVHPCEDANGTMANDSSGSTRPETELSA